MTKTIYLKRETDRARLWVLGNGREFWAPRSVCPRVTKFALEPGKPRRQCLVEFEDWWWEKNDPEREEQGSLKLGRTDQADRTERRGEE